MLGIICFAFALSLGAVGWHWREQAGAWAQLCAGQECVSSTQITALAPAPALPSSAVTTERRGNRKTELMLGNTASALSPNLQDFVIQGFLLVKQAIFGYIRQEPVQRALHPAYYFPSCEPWLQASSEASQETSPNSSTLRHSQRPPRLCQAATLSLSP